MTLETSDDKIKQICNEISNNTIRPAQEEALKIMDEARVMAQKIIKEGRDQKEAILKETDLALDEKNNIFQASLDMAVKQSIDRLKVQVVDKLFNKELSLLLESNINQDKVVAKMIDAMIGAIQSGGIDSDLGCAIAKNVDKSEVYAALSGAVKKRLSSEKVFIGSFKAGAQIIIEEKNLKLDFTDDAVKELLSEYVMDELKEKIFNV